MDIKQEALEIRRLIKKRETEKAIKIISSKKELLNHITPFGTFLHIAIDFEDITLVKKLVELGININIKAGVSEANALKKAASKGNLEIVEYLLSKNIEIDLSKSERNPLFGAITGGHVEIVKYLLDIGVDYKIKYNGCSALDYAIECGNVKIIEILKLKYNYEKEEDNSNLLIEESYHEKIENYMEGLYGKIKTNISEIIPGSRVAVNVNIIYSEEYIILFTTGMSDYPMGETNKFAELILKLPLEWPMGKNDMKVEQNFWPIEWLRKIAHLPHLYNGWVDEEVIIPNGEPPKPFSFNTELSSILISKPFDKKVSSLKISNRKIIEFYTLIPIYNEERQIGIDKGVMFLRSQFRSFNISDILNLKRQNIGKIEM